MISRRNIRVKVMQTLYSLHSMSDGAGSELHADMKQGNGLLNEKLYRSLDVFTTAILYTLEVARYAERDAHLRASRYLPTADDLIVNIKISGNEFLWQVFSNETFKEKVKESGLEKYVDVEWIKKLYTALAKTDEYIAYIGAEERQPKSEKAIIQYIWQELIMKNDALQEHFTDELPGYEDDREMVSMLMENFFRSPKGINFLSLISGEKKEYAQDLLKSVLQREEYIMELIKPRLVGWESDRIPLVDLILLQMGVCEFLYFPTIPTKATINEYIEVSKIYSTPQSGNFINGVLDNILKILEKEGKIRKQERTPKK